MKIYNLIMYIGSLLVLTNCAGTKSINKDNYIFEYVDNQVARVTDDSKCDEIKVYRVKDNFRLKSDDSKLTEQTNYYSLKIDKSDLDSIDFELIETKKSEPKIAKLVLNGLYYTHETDIKDFAKYNKSFKYTEFKLGLQALTIPLKFRAALDDGTFFPAQVETGTNIGFAPTLKYNINPTEKTLGKSENKYSISTGILLNIGATSLKKDSNAPGLQSDRKAGMLSYGTFLMLGFNNINIGYAIGADAVMGEGSDNWKYQNRLWQGVIIGLDILKF